MPLFAKPTSAEIDLLKTQAPELAARSEDASMKVFTFVFREGAALRTLWAGHTAEHARNMVATLLRTISFVEAEETLQPYLARIANRHRLLGMSPTSYFVLHNALTEMVETTLGADQATKDAWGAAIDMMIGTMLTEAHMSELRSLTTAA